MQLIRKLKRSVRNNPHKVLSTQNYVSASIASGSPEGTITLAFPADVDTENTHLLILSTEDAEGLIKSVSEQLGWVLNYNEKALTPMPDGERREYAIEVLQRVINRIRDRK